MQDLPNRLANLEKLVSELKLELIGIRLAMSQMPTRIDLTKRETSMVIWNAAMILASGAFAFIIAKSVN